MSPVPSTVRNTIQSLRDRSAGFVRSARLELQPAASGCLRLEGRVASSCPMITTSHPLPNEVATLFGYFFAVRCKSRLVLYPAHERKVQNRLETSEPLSFFHTVMRQIAISELCLCILYLADRGKGITRCGWTRYQMNEGSLGWFHGN